jgi:hypothetical protein
MEIEDLSYIIEYQSLCYQCKGKYNTEMVNMLSMQG